MHGLQLAPQFRSGQRVQLDLLSALHSRSWMHTTTTTDTISSTVATRFPDEVVLDFLQFLQPLEIVRLRLVSKQFNGVSRDARLWRILYTNSCLPRPPGPFLWQSRQFLECTLIHSERISQTWTSGPIRIASSVHGPRIPSKRSSVSTSFDFLFGRLLIWCEGDQILAQDIDTGIGRLLWQSSQPISSLDACSLTLPDGERVYIALRHVDTPVSRRTPIKLLEFPLQDDVRLTLGPVSFQMDLPSQANFPMSASASFLCLNGGMDQLFGHLYKPVVIDLRTRSVYTFPVFSSAFHGSRSWWPGLTFLSKRHIVVFHRMDLNTTLVQAFVIPEPLANSFDGDKRRLRLTHEVLVEGCPEPTYCLRSATVNQATGNANIRLLSTNTHTEKIHYHCIDITIPPIDSLSAEVLPMFVNVEELFILSGHIQSVVLDAFGDGHGRGFVTLTTFDAEEPWSHDQSVALYKFSIDASGEHCRAVVSEPCELSPEDVFLYRRCCAFDGIRGRICDDRKDYQSSLDLVVHSLH